MAEKAEWLNDEDFMRRYAAAVESGRKSEEREQRAKSARYDASTGRVVLELKHGCFFEFPARYVQGLSEATDEQLAQVRLLGSRGYTLEWEELDVHLAVPGIISGIFGSKAWMAELGRAGGRAKTPAKAAAARANGAKGGRPRKNAA